MCPWTKFAFSVAFFVRELFVSLNWTRKGAILSLPFMMLPFLLSLLCLCIVVTSHVYCTIPKELSQ